MFFTLLAIVILSFFIVSYSIYSTTHDRKTINQRVKTLNDFVFSIEEDVPRQLYIAGFRIIFLMEKKITESGQYMTNVNSTFAEAFYNGTLNGNGENLLQGVTYSDMLVSLNERAQKINAEITISHPQLTVTQVDPWNVLVQLETELHIQDKNNLVLWNRSFVATTLVPVENFEDPLYAVNTNSLVINKINKTMYQPLHNIPNLTLHATYSLYINSTLAPSFLDRLEGKTTANQNGIESLVYLPELSQQGITIKSKSVVDYIYFSTNDPSSSQIPGMPNWFRLDDNHRTLYGV